MEKGNSGRGSDAECIFVPTFIALAHSTCPFYLPTAFANYICQLHLQALTLLHLPANFLVFMSSPLIGITQ
ncbi:hypothetical protein POVWA2_050980 [Plasmodium ovale wallikeri]|uniref:Uncharacterized protein n=1 Tax=Plasmodium ovale wallikeri TaxID=864142 RepID=A0A1A8ZN95_PLAOA|nr:hypothetical protein POVWA1_051720 [Plasmodium ovale wallikeri]SBT45944.1 hypothetical protein POVWA2_050980 [Plasmodium ovale wallikeri]